MLCGGGGFGRPGLGIVSFPKRTNCGLRDGDLVDSAGEPYRFWCLFWLVWDFLIKELVDFCRSLLFKSKETRPGIWGSKAGLCCRVLAWPVFWWSTQRWLVMSSPGCSSYRLSWVKPPSYLSGDQTLVICCIEGIIPVVPHEAVPEVSKR